MSAAFKTAAPLAALAAASILAGCTVEPAPYAGAVYAEGPDVYVEPFYRFGYYDFGRYGHPYGPGFHDGGFHGGGMHGRG